jgi:clan AA aspartic protease (TIGR02281 family)
MNSARYLSVALPAFLSLPLLHPALADKIQLANGQSMEGIIKSENKTEIVLDIGVGSMTVKKNSVKSITRASEDEQAKILAKWHREYFLNKRYTPEGMEDLAEGYKNISGRRQDILGAIRSTATARAEEKKIQEEIVSLRTKLLEVSRSIASAKPSDDRHAYNTLIARNNALSAEIALKNDSLEKIRASLSAAQKMPSDYISALMDYTAKFKSRQAKYKMKPGDELRDLFFDEIRKKLETLSAECLEYSLQTEKHGNNCMVNVTINGTVPARLVLDTGASRVTIAESLASKLSLDMSKAQPARVTLADGKNVDAKSVILKSVKLGDALVEDIEALVLPSPPSDRIDGLLGMNFLQNFVMNLDATGKLQLRQFKATAK